MQLLLPFIYAILFILLIYKMNFFVIDGLSKRSIVFVFILKIIVGIVLHFIYTFYYPEGDMKSYFDDGNKLFYILTNDSNHFKEIILKGDNFNELFTWNASFEKTLYNDSRTMVLLNLLFRFFSFGNFYVHIIFMSFLSLIGLTAIYKTFIIYFKSTKKILFFIVFLLPSVLLWSSGVLKEGLLFLGVGLLLYTTNCGLATKYNFRNVLLLCLSIFILLFLKFYILIALLPGLFANFLISHSSNQFVFLKYISSYFILFVLIAFVSFSKPEFNPIKIIANKQEKSEAVAMGGVFLLSDNYFVRVDYQQKDEILIPQENNKFKIKLHSNYDQWKLTSFKDTIHIIHSTDTSLYKLVYIVVPPNYNINPLKLQPTISSLLKNTPKAFYNSLATPLEFGTKNWLIFCASLENIFYFLCIFLMIIYFKIQESDKAILFFCCSFFVIIYTLAGLTTPFAGALVRYRTPALPFMMIFIFMLVDKNKLKTIPFLGKYLTD